MRKFFKEFKDFAITGNMIDMAIGIVVGGAFTALVTSVVTNIITPLIGILIGVDFSTWEVQLPRLYGNAEPGTMKVGVFINSIISFLIITMFVFLFVKAVNRMRSKQNSVEEPPAEPEEPSAQEKLLTEIRDILRDQ